MKNMPLNEEHRQTSPLTHYCTHRVIYGDTDTMGMAYHANYLRWMEIGRTELFRAWGLPYKEIEARGIMLPVSEVTCKYINSARYDTLLLIETTLDHQIKGGLKFNYRIFDQADDKLLAQGSTRHACVNGEGRVVRPPDFVVKMIKERLAQSD
jgi:acyl-CoA thioester hydrolase